VRQLRAFGLFWWDFVVGDDWRMAAGVVVLLGATAILTRSGIDGWWLPPVAVLTVLVLSLARVVRRR
jgi:hypothetical protein